MPIFDVAVPANADKVGAGAAEIRTNIKTVFTTLFEGVVITVIDAVWECVQGWPRIYTAASGAAPVPAANADAGRLWFVTDLLELRAHDGTNWIRMSAPLDIRIPLYYGPGEHLTNAGYSYLPANAIYNAATGAWSGGTWTAGQGISFNKANAPTGATIKLCVIGSADVAAQAKVKIYDVTGGADVAGSEITLAADAPMVRETLSADLTAAIGAGARFYRVYVKGGTATYFRIASAELRIQRA